jgi:two-component system response regulator VicR
MRTVLLLEDDPNLGLILKEHLDLNGFQVLLCGNGEEGLRIWQRGKFDLCLVDIMMPKRDGFSFAREVRQRDNQIPIIFLTAKSLREDRIQGFRIGADDYITKPFSIEELLLRIRAVLRRTGQIEVLQSLPKDFAIGSYRFVYSTRTLQRKARARKLTAREADLLRLLCLHLNETLDRSTALKQLWGDDSYYNGRSMDVFLSRLRRYFRADKTIEILNVHGRGVKLVVAADDHVPRDHGVQES